MGNPNSSSSAIGNAQQVAQHVRYAHWDAQQAARPLALILQHRNLRKEIMDQPWVKIISITGYVGVIGLLFVILMKYFFTAEIINLLGSERFFYLLTLLVCGLMVALIIAIIKPKNTTNEDNKGSEKEARKDINITYNNNSTHNGDNNF